MLTSTCMIYYTVTVLLSSSFMFSKIIHTHVYQSYTASYVLAAIICEFYSFIMYCFVSITTQMYITSLLQSTLGRPSPDILNRCFIDKNPGIFKNREFYRNELDLMDNVFKPEFCQNFVVNYNGNMSIVGSRFECPIKYECVIIKSSDFYQIQQSKTQNLIKDGYRSFPCQLSANSAVVAGCIAFYVIRTFVFESRHEDYLKLGFFESLGRTPTVQSLLIVYCSALCLVPQIVGMSRIEDHRADVYGVVLGILIGFLVAGVVNVVYFSEAYFKWYMEQSSLYESTDSDTVSDSCANSYPSGKINVIRIQTTDDNSDSVSFGSSIHVVTSVHNSNEKGGAHLDRRMYEGFITRKEFPV